MVINQKEVKKLFIGNSTISKIYFGSLLVWQNIDKIKLNSPIISISDNTVSFDDIGHATSYAVYAGDILIGEYSTSSYEYEQEGEVVTLYNASENDIEFENGVVTLL